MLFHGYYPYEYQILNGGHQVPKPLKDLVRRPESPQAHKPKFFRETENGKSIILVLLEKES